MQARDLIMQRQLTEFRRAINRFVVPPAQLDEVVTQRERHELFRDLRAVVNRTTLEVFQVAKQFAGLGFEAAVQRCKFVVPQKPPDAG